MLKERNHKIIFSIVLCLLFVLISCGSASQRTDDTPNSCNLEYLDHIAISEDQKTISLIYKIKEKRIMITSIKKKYQGGLIVWELDNPGIYTIDEEKERYHYFVPFNLMIARNLRVEKIKIQFSHPLGASAVYSCVVKLVRN